MGAIGFRTYVAALVLLTLVLWSIYLLIDLCWRTAKRLVMWAYWKWEEAFIEREVIKESGCHLCAEKRDTSSVEKAAD